MIINEKLDIIKVLDPLEGSSSNHPFYGLEVIDQVWPISETLAYPIVKTNND